MWCLHLNVGSSRPATSHPPPDISNWPSPRSPNQHELQQQQPYPGQPCRTQLEILQVVPVLVYWCLLCHHLAPKKLKYLKWEWKWMKILHKCSDGLYDLLLPKLWCQNASSAMRLGLPLRIDQRGVPVPGGRGQKSGLHSITLHQEGKCYRKVLVWVLGFPTNFPWHMGMLLFGSAVSNSRLDPSESGVNGNVGLICSNQLVKLGILDYPILTFIWTIINPLLTHSHLQMARLDGPKSLWQCWASCVEWGVTVEPSSAQKTTECWAMFELWAMKNLLKIHEISMKYSEMNCFRDA